MPTNEPAPPDDPTAPHTARTVFDLWVALYRNARRPPVLDPKREKLIRKALETHGPDTVEAAVRGVACSEWHMGRNPQGKKYTDIELILRDAKHVEMFAGFWDDHQADPVSAMVDAMRQEGVDW